MKKILSIVSLLFSTILFAQNKPQRVVAECTVDYSISIGGENADVAKASSKTVYIKGVHSRVDWVSTAFTQTVLYDKAEGNAVILREIGNNKLMTKLDNAAWKNQNKQFDGSSITLDTATKIILGYECKKAILTLKSGTVVNLFYAVNIIPSVKEFEYQFKDVPGFVLEYESVESDGKKVKYTATKINLNPVVASKFEVPTSGYRIVN